MGKRRVTATRVAANGELSLSPSSQTASLMTAAAVPLAAAPSRAAPEDAPLGVGPSALGGAAPSTWASVIDRGRDGSGSARRIDFLDARVKSTTQTATAGGASVSARSDEGDEGRRVSPPLVGVSHPEETEKDANDEWYRNYEPEQPLLDWANDFARGPGVASTKILETLKGLCLLAACHPEDVIRIGASHPSLQDAGACERDELIRAVMPEELRQLYTSLTGVQAARYATRTLAVIGAAAVGSIGSKAITKLCSLAPMRIWEPSFLGQLEAKRDAIVDRTPMLQHAAYSRLSDNKGDGSEGRTGETSARGVQSSGGNNRARAPPTNTMQSFRPEEDSRHHWQKRPDVYNDREKFRDNFYSLVNEVRGRQNAFESYSPSSTDRMRKIMLRSESLVYDLKPCNISWAAEMVVECIIAAAVYGEEDITLQTVVEPRRLQQLSRRLAGEGAGASVSRDTNRPHDARSRSKGPRNGNTKGGPWQGNASGTNSRGGGGADGAHARRCGGKAAPREPDIPKIIFGLPQFLQSYLVILSFSNNYRLSSLVSRQAMRTLVALHRECTTPSGAEPEDVHVHRTLVPSVVNIRETALKLQALSETIAVLAMMPWEGEAGEDATSSHEMLRQSSMDAARELIDGLRLADVLRNSVRRRCTALSIPWILAFLRCIGDSSARDVLLDRTENSVVSVLLRIRADVYFNPMGAHFTTARLCVGAMLDAFFDEVGVRCENMAVLEASDRAHLPSCDNVGESGIDDDVGQVDVAYIRSFCKSVYRILDVMDESSVRFAGGHPDSSDAAGVGHQRNIQRRKIRAIPTAAAGVQEERDRGVSDASALQDRKIDLLQELFSDQNNRGLKEIVEFVVSTVSNSVVESISPIAEQKNNGATAHDIDQIVRERCTAAIGVTLNVLPPTSISKDVVLAAARISTEIASDQALRRIRSRQSRAADTSTAGSQGEEQTGPSTSVPPEASDDRRLSAKQTRDDSGESRGSDAIGQDALGSDYKWARDHLASIEGLEAELQVTLSRLRSGDGYSSAAAEEASFVEDFRGLSSALAGLVMHQGGTLEDDAADDASALSSALIRSARLLSTLCMGCIPVTGLPLDGVRSFAPAGSPFGGGKWIDGGLFHAAISTHNRGKSDGERKRLVKDHEESIMSRALMSPVAKIACSRLRSCWEVAFSAMALTADSGSVDTANQCSLLTEMMMASLEGVDWDGMTEQVRHGSPLWSRRATYAPVCLISLLLPHWIAPQDGGESMTLHVLAAFVARARGWLCLRQLERPTDVTGRIQALRTVAAIMEHVATTLILGIETAKCDKMASGRIGGLLAPLMRDALYWSEKMNDVRVHFWLLRLHRSLYSDLSGKLERSLLDVTGQERAVCTLRRQLIDDGRLPDGDS